MPKNELLILQTNLKPNMMSNLEKNFAGSASDNGPYVLHCVNNSTSDWIFYVYQTMPNQPSHIFSLAWLASPYKLQVGSSISFSWEPDYSFVWSHTGVLSPGIIFQSSGIQPCNLTDRNQTTFNLNHNHPQLKATSSEGQNNILTINIALNVPEHTFSTGIGMSNYGIFVQQASANIKQVYIPNTTIWIAATTYMYPGRVLSLPVSLAQSFEFKDGNRKLRAVFGKDNTWTFSG